MIAISEIWLTFFFFRRLLTVLRYHYHHEVKHFPPFCHWVSAAVTKDMVVKHITGYPVQHGNKWEAYVANHLNKMLRNLV
jgi:hypothetical protein